MKYIVALSLLLAAACGGETGPSDPAFPCTTEMAMEQAGPNRFLSDSGAVTGEYPGRSRTWIFRKTPDLQGIMVPFKGAEAQGGCNWSQP